MLQSTSSPTLFFSSQILHGCRMTLSQPALVEYLEEEEYEEEEMEEEEKRGEEKEKEK